MSWLCPRTPEYKGWSSCHWIRILLSEVSFFFSFFGAISSSDVIWHRYVGFWWASPCISLTLIQLAQKKDLVTDYTSFFCRFPDFVSDCPVGMVILTLSCHIGTFYTQHQFIESVSIIVEELGHLELCIQVIVVFLPQFDLVFDCHPPACHSTLTCPQLCSAHSQPLPSHSQLMLPSLQDFLSASSLHSSMFNNPTLVLHCSLCMVLCLGWPY